MQLEFLFVALTWIRHKCTETSAENVGDEPDPRHIRKQLWIFQLSYKNKPHILEIKTISHNFALKVNPSAASTMACQLLHQPISPFKKMYLNVHAIKLSRWLSILQSSLIYNNMAITLCLMFHKNAIYNTTFSAPYLL